MTASAEELGDPAEVQPAPQFHKLCLFLGSPKAKQAEAPLSE